MPAPDAWVDDDGLHFADGACQPFSLKLPGAVNRGNAGAALLAARVLGAPLAQAAERLADMRSASGRYASIRVGGRMARLVLAKNPASWIAVMQWAADHPIIAIVNARAADGRDTSWLYDVPFEVFQGRALGACGERAADVALRLHVAGVRAIVGADLDHVARQMPAGELHVLASYSAFTLLRRQAVEAP
jgi:UDP-N-acetylmuramyl tripeptide synthase